MAKHNPDNERIKRKYLLWLREAKRCSESTADAAAKAIARFEEYTNYRDLKKFHIQQAVAFKKHLAEAESATTGDKLSKATLYATFSHLKRFFLWLADQPGFKSRLRHCDVEYFNLSDKEARVATARREKAFPTVEQILCTLRTMPGETAIEQRNRALIAFTLLTGARDSATASMKLKHVNLSAGKVDQDARDVNTKFSKSFETYFFPVGDQPLRFVQEWVTYLRDVALWGSNDPLFPATRMELDADRRFCAVGLKREHWCNASPIRRIFREAFLDAGLPSFNPHSFRDTLTALGQSKCKTAEQFKAWSQNLGHESVLTTLYSYGQVATTRQGELIRGMALPEEGYGGDELGRLAGAVMRRINSRSN